MNNKKALVKLSNIGDYSQVPRDTNDDALVEMWLNTKRSLNTRAAYRRDISLFQSTVQKPLQAVIFADLQDFSDALTIIYPSVSSQARVLNAVKSLFSFALDLGYIRVKPSAILKVPRAPSNLAQRIMTREQIITMFAREPNRRNRILLRILYYGAVRVSELCALTWADVQPNAAGGQITVLGKGDKRRSILIPRVDYEMLLTLKGNASEEMPVFVSRQRSGRALTRVQVFNIVSGAAKLASVPGTVSPHWLRHAHASHALDRGAPVHLVRETLGHANISTTNNYAHARPGTSSSTYLDV